MKKLVSLVLVLCMLMGISTAFATGTQPEADTTVPEAVTPPETEQPPVEEETPPATEDEPDTGDTPETDLPETDIPVAPETPEDVPPIDDDGSGVIDGPITIEPIKQFIALEDAILKNIMTVSNEAGETKQILKIKELKDFASNKYFLVEFINGGYLIVHGLTGEIMEYALDDPSPYDGYNSDLYYLGALRYYILINGKLIYTEDTSESFEFTEEASVALSQKSTKMNSYTLSNSNNRTELLAQDVPTLDVEKINNKIQNELKKELFTQQLAVTAYNIPNYSIITNCNTASRMGYVESHCGYVATGLMLLYANKITDGMICNIKYLGEGGNSFVGPAFTKKLFSFSSNPGTGTDTLKLKTILEDYFAETHLSASINRLTTSGSSVSSIRNIISTYRVPVILIDNFEYLNISNIKDHAVIAYGYNSEGYILVHTGLLTNTLRTLNHYSLTAFDGAFYIRNPSKISVTVSDAAADWQKTAASYALRYGIMNYTYGTSFGCATTANKETFANALYAIADSPAVTQTERDKLKDFNEFSSYEHVPTSYNGVAWAYSKEVIKGRGDGYLGLKDDLNRQQAAVMLFNFANNNVGLLGFYRSNGPAASSFSDYNDVAQWAQTAVNWATQRYLLTGNNNELFPEKKLERVQLAQIILNLSNNAYKQ